MAIDAPEFRLDPPFDKIASALLSELGSEEAIKALPYDVLFRIMSHSDETHFISSRKPGVRLTGIVGPYSVYDADRSFLCTVNLHRGFFGGTLPEIDYVRRLPDFTVLYVSYTDSDGLVRDVQLIKREG